MNEENLPNWLLNLSQQQPDLAALRTTDGPDLSFGELYRQAHRRAGQLAGLGIRPGIRVALLMGNSLEFVYMVHALIQLRAVLVPLNVRLSPVELSWQLDDVHASVLICDERRPDLANAVTLALPHLLVLMGLDDHPASPYEPAQSYQPDELHTIIYSSGTTGRPKGVQLTYRNHFFNAQASYQNLPAGPHDCWLAVLPLFHVGGLAIILRGLFYVMPVLVQESFDPVAVNAAIDRQYVTLVSVVANMLARLLDERQDRPYPASFRYFLIGGGPVPPPLLERCARAGIPVIQTYGMTETASQSVTLAAADALRKLGSAGQPLPGVELRIERDDEAVGPDEIGEIVLRGPGITPGYDHRPAETERAWRGGWFHTGDLGRLDTEGFLFVVDRRDDLIISGGENVYPAEIEAVLLCHPAIAEAGVIGIPSERWGQVVGAFIKLRPSTNLTAGEVIAYCMERLARFKVPTEVHFVESLPRNATGKLLRRVLRDQL